jgi:hypothetical protein
MGLLAGRFAALLWHGTYHGCKRGGRRVHFAAMTRDEVRVRL